MTEPDQSPADPIGYRMADPCKGCGGEVATRRDCDMCRDCIELGESSPEIDRFVAAVAEDSECVAVVRMASGFDPCVSCGEPTESLRPLDEPCDRCRARAEDRPPSPGGHEPSVTAQDHYTATDIEPIDVIEAWRLPFSLGNVVKYIARHERKGGNVDLIKALSYLHRHIYGEWPDA